MVACTGYWCVIFHVIFVMSYLWKDRSQFHVAKSDMYQRWWIGFNFTAFLLLLICHCIFERIKNSKFLGTEESKINFGLSFLFDNTKTCEIYTYFRTYCNVYQHN